MISGFQAIAVIIPWRVEYLVIIVINIHLQERFRKLL